MREVARRLGLREDDKSLRAAWSGLRESGEIVHDGGVWQCGAVVASLGGASTAPHPEIVDAEVVCERCGAALTETPRGPVCIGCDSRGEAG
jgi:hypothetical protein